MVEMAFTLNGILLLCILLSPLNQDTWMKWLNGILFVYRIKRFTISMSVLVRCPFSIKEMHFNSTVVVVSRGR